MNFKWDNDRLKYPIERNILRNGLRGIIQDQGGNNP